LSRGGHQPGKPVNKSGKAFKPASCPVTLIAVISVRTPACARLNRNICHCGHAGKPGSFVQGVISLAVCPGSSAWHFVQVISPTNRKPADRQTSQGKAFKPASCPVTLIAVISVRTPACARLNRNICHCGHGVDSRLIFCQGCHGCQFLPRVMWQVRQPIQGQGSQASSQSCGYGHSVGHCGHAGKVGKAGRQDWQGVQKTLSQHYPGTDSSIQRVGLTRQFMLLSFAYITEKDHS
jgi:hypothetical protein